MRLKTTIITALFLTAGLWLFVSPIKSQKNTSTTPANNDQIDLDIKASKIIYSQKIEKIKSIIPAKKAKKLESFAELGLSYIKKVGKKRAFAEFNNPKHGMFNQDEIYFFAYDDQGNCLAHGLFPERAGKNYADVKDEFGHQVSKIASGLAKKGGGFLGFRWWSNPIKSVKINYVSYIEAIDNNSYIGTTFKQKIKISKSLFTKLKKLNNFVNSAVNYYKKYGQEKAFKEFNDIHGKFRKGNSYIFVLSYDGAMLAYGGDRSKGKSILAITDIFGTPVDSMLIKTAKAGGGLISYYWEEPSSKKTKLKISYVRPLTDNALIGSGIYED